MFKKTIKEEAFAAIGCNLCAENNLLILLLVIFI